MSTAHMDISPLLAKLQLAQRFTGEEMESMIRDQARLFVWSSGRVPGVINITPPFTQDAKTSSAALARGKASIQRDLSGVFQPVTIKGERRTTHLFGRPHPSAPWTRPTTEQWPDVASLVKQRWERKNATQRKVMTRGQKAPYYVDASKLEVARRESIALIGLACAAWWIAARQSGLSPTSVPAWITRHATGPGAGRIIITTTSIRITLSSHLSYNTALGMAERAARVLGYRESALARQLPHLLKAAIRKSNLSAA